VLRAVCRAARRSATQASRRLGCRSRSPSPSWRWSSW
jgi:hypothetical protein